MRRTQLFTKTQKQAPADEVAKNAQLLIRAGFLHKEMSGVYSFLPLGLKTLNNVVQIIRDEMNTVGGNEVEMSTLQNKELWVATDRWDDKKVDNWFKTTFASGAETGLGITHEEPITNMMRSFVSSYKDLPAFPYQFQTKFRNELRAKSGLMRGKEFLMKDLYSLTRTQAEHDEFYEKISKAYDDVFSRLGIGEITYKTFASGGIFAKYSHEFQTISDVGEDTIYVHHGKKIAINKEVYNDEVLADLNVKKDDLEEVSAVETGNIFSLGTRFSEPLNLNFTDEDGSSKPVIMGSYGIGPSRLVGLLAEHFADEKGLVWPINVSPYHVYLASVGDDIEVVKASDKLYEEFKKAGVEVLYDDRDTRPGDKFADADLMGIPIRIVVSNRTLENKSVEYKERTSESSELVGIEEIVVKVTAKINSQGQF